MSDEDDGSDCDSSSVFDISDFLSDTAVAAATGNPLLVSAETAANAQINADNDAHSRFAITREENGSSQSKPLERPLLKDAHDNLSKFKSSQTKIENPSAQSTIRIVMGESVLQYRRQLQQKTRNDDDDDEEEESPSSSLSVSKDYMLWRQTPQCAASVSWRNAQAQISDDGNLVSLLSKEGSQNKQDEESFISSSPVEYRAKDIQKPTTVATKTIAGRNSHSLMSVIAIWDPQQGIYRLEIPALIATDLVASTKPRDLESDDRKRTPKSPVNLASVDPVMHSRQAEAAVRAKRKQTLKGNTTRPRKRSKPDGVSVKKANK